MDSRGLSRSSAPKKGTRSSDADDLQCRTVIAQSSSSLHLPIITIDQTRPCPTSSTRRRPAGDARGDRRRRRSKSCSRRFRPSCGSTGRWRSSAGAGGDGTDRAHGGAGRQEHAGRPDRSASWAAAATTTSSRPSSTASPRAASSTRRTRPISPRSARATCRSMFEYQTLISQLTGMDVSNASLYDGGSAAAEAVLMAISATRPHGRVVVAAQRASRVSPDPRDLPGEPRHRSWSPSARPRARSSRRSSPRRSTTETACVLVQHPNFFGCLEDVEAIGRDRARRRGAAGRRRSIRSAWACSSGRATTGPTSWWPKGNRWATRWRTAGRTWASWPAASSSSAGCRAGSPAQTVDRRGKRCWVLTLQTREQHIRREKATSNICTNQGLFALRATVYLAAHGAAGPARGGRALPAEGPLRRASSSRPIGRFALAFERPTFKEFVVRDRRRARSTSCWRAAATPASSPACRWAAGIRNWPIASWSR